MLKTEGQMQMYFRVYTDISEAKRACIADANYSEMCLKPLEDFSMEDSPSLFIMIVFFYKVCNI